MYSFHKDDGANWAKGKRVNDVDTTAKEGLAALSADAENASCCMAGLKRKREK